MRKNLFCSYPYSRCTILYIIFVHKCLRHTEKTNNLKTNKPLHTVPPGADEIYLKYFIDKTWDMGIY